MINHLKRATLCILLGLGSLQASNYTIVDNIDDPNFLGGRHNLSIHVDSGMDFLRTIKGTQMSGTFSLSGENFSLSKTMTNGEIIRNLRKTGNISYVKRGEEITDIQLEESELNKEDDFSQSVAHLIPPHLRDFLAENNLSLKGVSLNK